MSDDKNFMSVERINYSIPFKVEIKSDITYQIFAINMKNSECFDLRAIRVLYTSVNEISPQKFNSIYRFWDDTELHLFRDCGRDVFNYFLTQLFTKTKFYYKKNNNRLVQRYEAILNLSIREYFEQLEYLQLRVLMPKDKKGCEGDELFIDFKGTLMRKL